MVLVIIIIIMVGPVMQTAVRRRGRSKTTMMLSRKSSVLNEEEDQQEPSKLTNNFIDHNGQTELVSGSEVATLIPSRRKKSRPTCEIHEPENLVITTEEIVKDLSELKSSELSSSISTSTDSDIPRILPVQPHDVEKNTSSPEHRRQPLPCQIRLSYMVSENFATAEFCTAPDPDRTAFRRVPREPYCNVSVGFTFGHIIQPA